jgi:hypothetical protein
VKPLSIVPVCIVSSQVSFIFCGLSTTPIQTMYNYIRRIIPLSVIFLHHSFRILGSNPQYSWNNCFWEKQWKWIDVFGMYSSSDQLALSFLRKCNEIMQCFTPIMPHLSQVRNVGGEAGLKGRHLWVVPWSRGCGSSEKGDKFEPELEPSFIKLYAAFMCTQWHSFTCTTSASMMNRILKLELALYHLKCNVSTNNRHTKNYL